MKVWRWEVIARLCHKHGLKTGAEIGVADGRFSRELLGAIPDLILWAVDYWPPNYKTWDGKEWSADFQEKQRSIFLEFQHSPGIMARLGLLEMPSVEAAKEIKNGTLDFVFIDADHSYEAVKADICAWRPKVRQGGFLAGHDYDSRRFPGVVKAVDELIADFKTQEDYVWISRLQ